MQTNTQFDHNSQIR